MAIDVSGIAAWTEELGNKADYIIKPILAARTLQALTGVDKRMGIKGQTVSIPTLEVTTPWQGGATCSPSSSGTTTIDNITITTVPIQTYQTICLRDLETYAVQQGLAKDDRAQTWDMLNNWTGRIGEQLALQVESSLWQSKTTYTNATHLKRFNGWINIIDGASPIAATQQVSISTSTVRGIIEEIAYTKIPARIRLNKPVIVCGIDTFLIYQNKLMVDNLYHYDPSNTDLGKYEMNVYGSNVRLIGLPGLNNDNAVDTGVLPTEVKNRIFATYEDNLIVGMNAENDFKDFNVWYSPDDMQIKCLIRFHLGVAVKYGDLIVQYTNS